MRPHRERGGNGGVGGERHERSEFGGKLPRHSTLYKFQKLKKVGTLPRKSAFVNISWAADVFFFQAPFVCPATAVLLCALFIFDASRQGVSFSVSFQANSKRRKTQSQNLIKINSGCKENFTFNHSVSRLLIVF